MSRAAVNVSNAAASIARNALATRRQKTSSSGPTLGGGGSDFCPRRRTYGLLHDVEEPPRAQDANTAPGVQIEEIAVAGNDDVGADRGGKFEILVVLRVTTVGNGEFRLDPDGGVGDQRQNSRPVFVRQVAGELRTCEYVADFSLDRRRQGNDTRLPRLQDCLPGRAIALEGRGDDGAGVNDDQRRRSAL